jgi:hypothetical protein
MWSSGLETQGLVRLDTGLLHVCAGFSWRFGARRGNPQAVSDQPFDNRVSPVVLILSAVVDLPGDIRIENGDKYNPGSTLIRI